MKSFLFFSLTLISIIFISTFILTSEKENTTIISNETKINNTNINKTSNSTIKNPKPKRKPKFPPPLKSTSKIPNDTSQISNRDIYSLNDLTFDMVLRGGNNYKWLVILYSETCGHCEHARREIRKVFPDYSNSTSIRFAEIEINKNYLTNLRFDIEGVPYIFLLQNESIYELDLFPSEKNLRKFIETNFSEVEEDLKPFPRMVPFYTVAFVVISNIFRGITNMINDFIFDLGFEFEFTPTVLFMSFVGFIASICILEFFCCAKFCPEEKPKKKKKKRKLEEEKRKIEEEKKEIEEEKKKIEEEKKEIEEEEEEEEEDDEEEIKKIEELKKQNEEEKKKIEQEKKKIQEKKDKKKKKNQEDDNNKEKGNKKDKKKKE